MESSDLEASAQGKPAPRLLTFWRLLGLSALLSLAIAAAWLIYADYSLTQCDRAASSEVGTGSAALERLGNELGDLNIRFDNNEAQDTIVAANGLRYLVGPYYGWRGGSRKCQVLFRFAKVDNDWKLQGTALKGSQPAGQNSRYVYKTPVAGEHGVAAIMHGIVDARNGKSEDWNAYPYREGPDAPERCYTDSMVDQSKKARRGGTFAIKAPHWVPCDRIRNLD